MTPAAEVNRRRSIHQPGRRANCSVEHLVLDLEILQLQFQQLVVRVQQGLLVVKQANAIFKVPYMLQLPLAQVSPPC